MLIRVQNLQIIPRSSHFSINMASIKLCSFVLYKIKCFIQLFMRLDIYLLLYCVCSMFTFPADVFGKYVYQIKRRPERFLT